MGAMQSWVAVRGRSRRTVLEALHLVATGEREEFPEAPLGTAQLRGGWTLVVQNADGPLHDPDAAARLSRGGVVVSGHAFEGPMFSDAVCYRDGELRWSVAHDASQGIYDLTVEGDPPKALASIRARLERMQGEAGGSAADVDHVFGVPVELAGAVTGYRYDEDVASDDGTPFEVLEHRPPPPPPKRRRHPRRGPDLIDRVASSYEEARDSLFGLPRPALLFVVLITLAAFVAYTAWRLKKRAEPVPEPSIVRKIEMLRVRTEAASFWREYGQPPRSVQVLDLADDAKRDSWGSPYEIAVGDRRDDVVVRSLGPDRTPGTVDDEVYPDGAAWPDGE